MAGQLGLNPPTMTLCQGGAIDELEKALENSEAVAKCFNCSISTSAIAFVIYCSTKIPSTERFKIQDKQDAFLKQTRVFNLDKGTNSEAFDPIFLYVLVPDLPKGYCSVSMLGLSSSYYALGRKSICSLLLIWFDFISS